MPRSKDPDRPAAAPADSADRCPSSSSRNEAPPPLADWIDSNRYVLGLWLDRLIADGDPDDLISMVHRQHAWLSLMRAHLDPS